MGILDKLGSKYWKDAAEKIQTDAPKELGTFLYQSPVTALRIYTIGELLKFIYDPYELIEYRIIACQLFLSENISFMEPRQDEHTQIVISELLALIGDTWQPQVDSLVFLEKEAKGSNDYILKQEVKAFRWSMTRWADKILIGLFVTLVYNKGFSKEDHLPNTIVVGHSVPQMGIPGQQGFTGMQTTNTLETTYHKPIDDPIPENIPRRPQ